MADTAFAPSAFGEPKGTRNSELLRLCLPDRHDLVVEPGRRRTMDRRVQLVAYAIAALTTGWIGVDALSFSAETWIPLAVERLLASILLVLFAIPILHQRRGRLVEVRALLVLLVVLGFFLSASYTLWATHANMGSLAASSAYVNLPYLVAAGISLFPIVAAEGLVITGLVLGTTAVAAVSLPLSDAYRPYNVGSLWLLLTVCGVATVGGVLQLRLLMTVAGQSCRDRMTGLLRRGVGEELLTALFASSERANQPLSLLFLDLDEFKTINDGYGHEAGDAVLETAAAAIRSVVRRQDTAVRWGGEEFLIILPNTEASGSHILIERLGRHGLGQRPDGRPLTASVGLAERRADGTVSAAELVATADERVYAAKRAGRNRVMDSTNGQPRAFVAASGSMGGPPGEWARRPTRKPAGLAQAAMPVSPSTRPSESECKSSREG